MPTFKDNIDPGGVVQYVIGDARKHAFVTGTFSVIRGHKRQAGPIDVISTGAYDVSYVGNNCGVTLLAYALGHKLLLKISTDNSDTDHVVFSCNLRQIYIT